MRTLSLWPRVLGFLLAATLLAACSGQTNLAPQVSSASAAGAARTTLSTTNSAQFGRSTLFNTGLLGGLPDPFCATGAPNNDTDNGFVSVLRLGSSSQVTVHVVLHRAQPNLTYLFDRSCVALIGTLTTNEAGNAEATFTIPSPLGDNTFVFDVGQIGVVPFYSTGLITITTGNS